MQSRLRWTSADLDAFPDDDGKRYEIIDGELYVSKQPHLNHQGTSVGLSGDLDQWCRRTGNGVVWAAPGLIFAEDDDVAPDLAWVSQERLPTVVGTDGRLHAAPDLVVEILSPGAANVRRDRDAKLNLYSRRGVQEYWIVDWRRRRVDIYRRGGNGLDLVATLVEADTLQSPLLPGFQCELKALFARLI